MHYSTIYEMNTVEQDSELVADAIAFARENLACGNLQGAQRWLRRLGLNETEIAHWIFTAQRINILPQTVKMDRQTRLLKQARWWVRDLYLLYTRSDRYPAQKSRRAWQRAVVRYARLSR